MTNNHADLFTKDEEFRIRQALSQLLPGNAITATTAQGEEVEVWFSFDGSLNIKHLKNASFS